MAAGDHLRVRSRVTDPLADYREKRDFARTPEPTAGEPSSGGTEPRFVIQRHAARALHFDLRLEHEDVCSWAVPKDAAPRGCEAARRATEDHPVEYLNFSGRSPGEYGARRMTLGRGLLSPHPDRRRRDQGPRRLRRLGELPPRADGGAGTAGTG